MQQPTLTNTRIRSSADAQKIFYAIEKGILKMVTKRLDVDERIALRSGNIYAWEERGSHSEVTGLGIERFTEGRRWSPSRVREDFLFYYEKYAPPPNNPGGNKAPRDWEGLVKQTYSVWVDTQNGRRKWHLTAYFGSNSVDTLGTVDDLPQVDQLEVPTGHFKCTRSLKPRNKKKNERRASVSSDAGSTCSRTYAAYPPVQSAEASSSPIEAHSPYISAPRPAPALANPYPPSGSSSQANPYPSTSSGGSSTVSYHSGPYSRSIALSSPAFADSHGRPVSSMGSPTVPNVSYASSQDTHYSYPAAGSPQPMYPHPASNGASNLNPTPPNQQGDWVGSPIGGSPSVNYAYPSFVNHLSAYPTAPLPVSVYTGPSTTNGMQGSGGGAGPYGSEGSGSPLSEFRQPSSPSSSTSSYSPYDTPVPSRDPRGTRPPERSLAPLQNLTRAHPYRRNPADEMQLQMVERSRAREESTNGGRRNDMITPWDSSANGHH